MTLFERLKPRIVAVSVSTPDGIDETIHMQTLSTIEWNDVGFAVPYPDKDSFMIEDMKLVNGQPTVEKKLDAIVYRRAMNDFSDKVALYRLGAALVGGGDFPEFANMSHEKRAEALGQFDNSIVRALIEALAQISIKGASEVQTTDSDTFRGISGEGTAHMSENGLVADSVASSKRSGKKPLDGG